MTAPAIPTVDMFMSPLPHSIGADQTLTTAHLIMRRHKIRHLPVMRAGVVIGLLSSRDLDFVEALAGIDPDKVMVEDAMSQDPYCVERTTPLAEVALSMAQHRYGCAIVKDGAHLVGVFTMVDGMRVLGELLRRETVVHAQVPPDVTPPPKRPSTRPPRQPPR